MIFLRNFISFLLYSNLFIALCATALVYQTEITFDLKISPFIYLFVFSATLIEYNVQRFLVITGIVRVPDEPRYKWLYDHAGFFYFLLISTISLLLYSIYHLPRFTYLWIIVAALLTVLYNFPLLPTSKGFKRLRALPHMKVVTIALVWNITTLLIPLEISKVDLVLLMLAFFTRFLFIVAITIPFDARDIRSDEKRGLKTIPLVFGVERSYRIATGLLFMVILLSVISWIADDNLFGSSMIITSLLTILFIKKEGWRAHPFYYYGILDGTMLLAPVLQILLLEYFVK